MDKKNKLLKRYKELKKCVKFLYAVNLIDPFQYNGMYYYSNSI